MKLQIWFDENNSVRKQTESKTLIIVGGYIGA